MPAEDPRISKVWQALSHAQNAFAAFNQISVVAPFAQYEERWISYLSMLDRVWEKAQSACARCPGWEAVREEYVLLRRTDPVLRYLMEARNADQHTIQEVVEDRPLSWLPFEYPEGHPLAGQPLPTDEQGRQVVTGGSIVLRWTEPKRVLVAVRGRQRGELIAPPQEHLRQPLRGTDPKSVGLAALRFYERMVADLAGRFFGAQSEADGSR